MLNLSYCADAAVTISSTKIYSEVLTQKLNGQSSNVDKWNIIDMNTQGTTSV